MRPLQTEHDRKLNIEKRLEKKRKKRHEMTPSNGLHSQELSFNKTELSSHSKPSEQDENYRIIEDKNISKLRFRSSGMIENC